ncbi:hypothetical protein BFJ63_vAg20098 [Fusarium oxysporum f. sp. narcissi]|uniref:Uncharacterized protein n=1 Tax=Fusarium oxysporum f. sp. narcissi TaxID=451672 RepID=A0A4Q2UZW5_FUSOX|nr:hypothetical protein BFJ63_vAg20098 [Fusarium oxysporum f. sp. narcissi]
MRIPCLRLHIVSLMPQDSGLAASSGGIVKLRNRSNRSTVSSDRSIYIDQGLQSIDIDRFGSNF